MLKNILKYSLYALLGIVFLGVMGFVEYKNEHRLIDVVNIEITDYDRVKFIDEDLVGKSLFKIYDSIESRNRKHIDLALIENQLSQMESVRKVDAFFGVDGHLNLVFIQKHPIARIIDENSSYYMDEKGERMSLQKKYSSAVIVVFVENSSKYNKEGMYELVSKINGSQFLKKQIASIRVLENGKINLETNKGKHFIEFGKPFDIDKKLKKLITYYEYTVAEFGWDTYKKINLEFANQVVCTK